MLCFVFSIFLRQQEELTKAEPFAIALGKQYEGHVAPAFAWDKETTETTMPLRPAHKTSTLAARALICMLFTTLLPPPRRCVYYWQRFCRPCADLHTICTTLATRAPICTLFTTLLPAVCRQERPRISPERPPTFWDDACVKWAAARSAIKASLFLTTPFQGVFVAPSIGLA